MRVIKGLVLFCFLGAVVSSCFDEPEFRSKPEVIFKKIFFGDAPSGQDSLVLVFDFKDGDGNLGLNDFLIDSPYNAINFFAENPELLTVRSVLVQNYNGVKSKRTNKQPTNPKYYIRYIPEGKKLVTLRSKKNGFPSLPTYTPPYSTCIGKNESYLVDTVYVSPKYGNSVLKARIVDTLLFVASNNIAALTVVDTFYNKENFDYYNFRVRFYEKVGGSFQEFDWRKQFCATFDGRFTVLSDKEGPLEGVITYPMKSSGFITLFSVKTLYLEFEILDRDLNVSNTERTTEFTLDQIKQK